MSTKRYANQNDAAGRWLKKKNKQIKRAASKQGQQRRAAERDIVREAEKMI